MLLPQARRLSVIKMIRTLTIWVVAFVVGAEAFGSQSSKVSFCLQSLQFVQIHTSHHPHFMNNLLKKNRWGVFMERFDSLIKDQSREWTPKFKEYVLQLDWLLFVHAVENRRDLRIDQRNLGLLWFIHISDQFIPFQPVEFIVEEGPSNRIQLQRIESLRAAGIRRLIKARDRAILLLRTDLPKPMATEKLMAPVKPVENLKRND